MALRLLDTTAIINRTTNLVQGSSDGCFQFWFMTTAVSTSPDYLTAWAQLNAGYTAWNGIFSNASVSAGEMQISADNGGGPSGSANFVVLPNTPVNFGYRRFGTTHQLLCNGFIVGTVTEDMTAVTFIEQVLGYDGFSVIPGTLLFWDYKEWSSSKSVGTIRDEMAAYGTVINTLNLNCFTPLVSDLLDDSGNGNDWSGAGNFDFVANPSLPQNVSPATATVITSLPFVETIGETYNLPLWYKRTPVAPESYLPGWGFGGLGTYEPIAFVWTGDGTVEWPDASWQTIATNVPFETPVVPAQDFYVEFRSQFGGAGGQLDVSFLPEPTETPPVGLSFLVTDDSPGYGATIISSVDGHVYQFRYPGFPASSTGTDLVNGSRRILLVSDIEGDDPSLFTNELWLYDADLTLLTQIPRGADVVTAVAGNTVDAFYVVYNPAGAVDGYVRKFLDDGTFDASTIGPLTGGTGVINGLAVSLDETILYWQQAGNNLGAIHQWDLVNNGALPDLVASPGAGWFGLGVLMAMPNGDLIGGFDQFLLGTQGVLRRYSSAGTILWTYDVGALTIDYHGAKLEYGDDWPDSLWLIVHYTDGHSEFIHLNADTGADLGDGFTVATFTTGAYDPAESATPEARTGPAPSCTYIMLREALAPDVCPGLMGAPRIGL